MEEDVCPICRDKPKDIYITSCNHAFCGPCICNYLFRAVTGAHGATRAVCPSCRQRVSACTTTTHADHNSMGIAFKLGPVLLEVDTPYAAPTSRLAKLLKTSPNSIKLVHKGRKLHGDKELLEAAALKGPITLLPAMLPKATIPQRLARTAACLLLCCWHVLFHAVLLPAWRCSRPLRLRVWVALQPASRVVAAFLRSMNPQYDDAVATLGDGQAAD